MTPYEIDSVLREYIEATSQIKTDFELAEITAWDALDRLSELYRRYHGIMNRIRDNHSKGLE